MNIRLALMGAFAMLLVFPAHAQNASVDNRVTKLEKEMKAVQRQVFPNSSGQFIEPDIATPETVTQTQPSTTTAVADLLSRVDALEAQLATVTGQVEQHGNDMRSFEARLKTLEAQMAKPVVAPVDTPNPISDNNAAKPPAVPVTSPVAAKPTAARTTAVAAIEKPATGEAFEDGYNYGYRLWEAKFYPEAQAQLQATIDKNPKHQRAGFARNLLGRAWLDDKKPASAVKILYDNYKNDPQGERAPDSLLYLGVALTDLGKNVEACEAFGQLAASYPAEAKTRLSARLSQGRAQAKCK